MPFGKTGRVKQRHTKHQTESDRVNYEMAFGVEKCDKSPQSWILDSTPWIQDSL